MEVGRTAWKSGMDYFHGIDPKIIFQTERCVLRRTGRQNEKGQKQSSLRDPFFTLFYNLYALLQLPPRQRAHGHLGSTASRTCTCHSPNHGSHDSDRCSAVVTLSDAT